MFQTLQTERVVLRPFLQGDISPDYVSWLNDPQVVRYSNQRFVTHTQASCRAYLESFAGTPNLFLSVRMRADDRAVGTMTAYRSLRHGTVDMGILIGHGAARGIGVGQEVWNLLLGWLVDQPDIRKVTAGAMRSNVAMIRIMQRSGMSHEATRAKQELLDGVPEDLLYFAKFPDH